MLDDKVAYIFYQIESHGYMYLALTSENTEYLFVVVMFSLEKVNLMIQLGSVNVSWRGSLLLS